MEEEFIITVEFEFEDSGSIKDLSESMIGNTFSLPPSNGNKVRITATARTSNGKPKPNVLVACWSEPLYLTDLKWRDKNKFSARFGRSSSKMSQRIDQGLVRLKTKITPPRIKTDRNGKATFILENFHICGNEGKPASDKIYVKSIYNQVEHIVKSELGGLKELKDNKSGGVMTSGLIGRHLQPDLIKVIGVIGNAWTRVGGKPSGMPNYVTITGASMKWGGLNPPHFTHRFGGAIDMRPIGTKSGRVSAGDAHYHQGATAILIDFLKRTGATKIIFAENLPGVTKVDSSHKDHIHASWLKKPDEPWLVKIDENSKFTEEVNIKLE